MNKVWMITGAGRGLGREFAEEALRRGDSVIATVRKPLDDPFMKNEQVLQVVMDVTDPAAVESGVKAGIERFGQIDILVNNAGFGMRGTFEEVSLDELRMLFETDYFGLVSVTKAVLPYMRAKKQGMILNVSSQAGIMGFLGSTSYCSAKYAVAGLSHSLRSELSEFGIQVSVVCPGSFRTDFRDASSMKEAASVMAEYAETAAGQNRENQKLGNHKQPGDPKKAAKFLCDVVDSGTLPSEILIGKVCCAKVREDLLRRIAEIDSYIDASSNTDFPEGQ